VRRVDLLWMVCHQRRNQVAEIIVAGGLGILWEEWRGDRRPYHRCVWCSVIPSLGFCGRSGRSLPLWVLWNHVILKAL
jgi:hypothetical protein